MNKLLFQALELEVSKARLLAAQKSKEKEDMCHQLDEARLLIRILKGNMLEEVNLLQMNNYEPSDGINDILKGSEIELCKRLADYQTYLMMSNMLAKDIESSVFAFELKQQKQMQKQSQQVLSLID